MDEDIWRRMWGEGKARTTKYGDEDTKMEMRMKCAAAVIGCQWWWCGGYTRDALLLFILCGFSSLVWFWFLVLVWVGVEWG